MSWPRMTSLPRNRGAALLDTLQQCPQTVFTGDPLTRIVNNTCPSVLSQK